MMSHNQRWEAYPLDRGTNLPSYLDAQLAGMHTGPAIPDDGAPLRRTKARAESLSPDAVPCRVAASEEQLVALVGSRATGLTGKLYAALGYDPNSMPFELMQALEREKDRRDPLYQRAKSYVERELRVIEASQVYLGRTSLQERLHDIVKRNSAPFFPATDSQIKWAYLVQLAAEDMGYKPPGISRHLENEKQELFFLPVSDFIRVLLGF